MEYEAESDLRVLEAMAANLTPYLYEDNLFGTLSPNLPKLTVGALLFRLYRLKGLEEQLSPDQQSRLHDAQLNFQQLRSEWMAHYEGKIEQEIQSRLRSFRNYLDDYGEQATRAREGYPAEATHRTILHHLEQEAHALEIWTEELEEDRQIQDARLRTALGDEAKGDFIWAKALKPLYPREDFWWLYGYPQED